MAVVDYFTKFEWLVAHYSAKTPKGKNGGVITRALADLAEDLSTIENMRRPWSKEYLFQIRRKSPKSVIDAPSPVFRMAVDKLWRKLHAHKRIRKRGLRLYTPMQTRDEVEYIKKHLSAQERREALLIAAGFEDFGE